MEHEHYEQINSTQEYLVGISPETNYLVSCDHQLHGLGRQGRKWQHQEGALAMSFSLAPCEVLTLSALEIAVLINEFFDRKLLLKWPNDIYDPYEKKCGGILIDSKNQRLVVGCGLNLLPNSEFGCVFPRQLNIETKVLAAEIYQYILNHRKEPSEIIAAWEKHCFHINKKVKIDKLEGVFIGVGRDGEALIDQGLSVQKVYSGSLLFG